MIGLGVIALEKLALGGLACGKKLRILVQAPIKRVDQMESCPITSGRGISYYR